MGRLIAAQLRHENVPFVIVELDPAHMIEALQEGMLAVEADASREEVLKRVGIQNARALIAALGTDAQNVYTVLSARVLRPDLFVVARAAEEDSQQKLLRAGANRVVLPYQIGATQIVQSALRPAVVDFVQLATNSANIELAMEEVAIAQKSPLANRTVQDANLQQRYGVIVIGIQREDQRMDFNPEPAMRVKPGDKLVVLGRPQALKQLAAEAAS
jgi:voltage-gated potassium channel